MSPIAVGCQKYFCCFIGAIVGLYNRLYTLQFFTIIFAVLIIENCSLFSFRDVLSYTEVEIAVSIFNKTIECVFVFYRNFTSITHRS